jgi:hypothetical protein
MTLWGTITLYFTNVGSNMALWVSKRRAARPHVVITQSLPSVPTVAVQFVPSAGTFRKRCDVSNTGRRPLSIPPLRNIAITYESRILMVYTDHGIQNPSVWLTCVEVGFLLERRRGGWQRKLKWLAPLAIQRQPPSPMGSYSMFYSMSTHCLSHASRSDALFVDFLCRLGYPCVATGESATSQTVTREKRRPCNLRI